MYKFKENTILQNDLNVFKCLCTLKLILLSFKHLNILSNVDRFSMYEFKSKGIMLKYWCFLFLLWALKWLKTGKLHSFHYTVSWREKKHTLNKEQKYIPLKKKHRRELYDLHKIIYWLIIEHLKKYSWTHNILVRNLRCGDKKTWVQMPYSLTK